MRILHLIAPVAFGGGESLLYNLLGEKREGISEAVALIYASRLFEEKLEGLGVQTLRLSGRDIGQGISKWKALLATPRNLRSAGRLSQFIRQEGIDVLHAHGYPACVLACATVKGRIPKKIYTHHGLREVRPRSLERMFLERIYRRFDALTGVSSAVCRSMNEAFSVGKRFRTVYNCVSPRFFEPGEAGGLPGILPATKKARFVQIGRFTDPKNQLLVTRSLARLDPRFLERIEVIFAGEGPTLEEIKVVVRAEGLDHSVRFLGHLPYADMPRLLAQCDYGLLPGKLEGMPVGIIECLSKGLPVLSVDTDLAREIIGKNGVLVPEDRFHEGFGTILQKEFNREEIREYARRFSPASV
ncbi:MAG: glycosyltransferase, partial [Deltaproteobacteria bacterium]|nr:glycosyltransferase [Deltaproteobacteria bacterium]